jgi:hypothetical protein
LAATSISTVIPESTEYGQIATTQEIEKVAELSPLNDEKIVRSYFRDLPIMVQIARCESSFTHTLADGSILRGRVDNADTGVMQINRRFHEKTAEVMNLDLNDIYHNMAYARYLYETQGTQPWSASAPCWGQTLAMNTAS